MSAHATRLGIVVGIDGSNAAKVAIHWAAHEAAMLNVPLTLVNVVNLILSGWQNAPVPVMLDRLQKERGLRLVENAERVARECVEADRPVEVRSEVLVSPTVPALVDLSNEAHMIVVGCRGRGAFNRVLLGSVSNGLVQHAHCPVAVIHDEDPAMPHPSQASVLVGVDGSPASELATSIAFDEASRRGVDLVALHAWSDVTMVDLPIVDWSSVKTEEEELLAERLAGWQERYPDVEVNRLVVCDKPARQLIEHSAAAQLVVVGSHGRGGFAGMALGSVSAAVVNAAQRPVIVARQG
ncbi:MAG: universal stress protein [Mycobacterium sp.]